MISYAIFNLLTYEQPKLRDPIFYESRENVALGETHKEAPASWNRCLDLDHVMPNGWVTRYCLCRDCGEWEWRAEYAREYSECRGSFEMHNANIEFCDAMCVEAERRLNVERGSIAIVNFKRAF